MVGKLDNLWQRFYEGIGHLLRLHFSAAENEHPDSVPSVGIQGSWAVAKPVIFGQDDPSSLPGLRYPFFVFGILGEVVVVDLYAHTFLAKPFRNYLLAQ